MERLPAKIVLTGGPSGGKSTLQTAVMQQIPEAYCAPEMATILLSGGFPTPTEDHPWDENWQRDLQTIIAAGQAALEGTVMRRAIRERKRCVVLDRGLLDGAAYLPQGMQELEALTGQTEHAMLENYDLVLHLPSSAIHGAYNKVSNPHRFEEAQAALRIEHNILTAWQNHPNRILLDEPDKHRRIAQGIATIQSIVNQA